jgi:MoxR-like ATPase
LAGDHHHADRTDAAARRRERDAKLLARIGSVRQTLLDEIGKVIVGQEIVIEQILVCLFCRGHGLIVGVPGLAKTLMVRTLARCMSLEFRRIQFTPDLMPSDITGTEVLEIDPETQERRFHFVRGPIFTNILLADEINRTPPKTQAALLESMQEYNVTVGGQTHPIPQPFFTLATQNPIEQEGTYPLPEAQLDRFMLNILIDYPTRAEEIQIYKSTTHEEIPEAAAVLDGRQIEQVQQIVRRMPISDHLLEYVANLVRATRPEDEDAPKFVKDYVEWGAGPRAGQYLVLGAKALALIEGRFNVSCNDVRAIAHPVLRHRMFTNFNADSEGVGVEDIIARLLRTVKEPGEEDYARKARRRRAAKARPAQMAVEDEPTDA